VIDGFQGHAACQSTITDDSNAFVRLTPVVPRHRHPQRSGNRGARVTGSEMIEATLRTLEVSSHPTLLTQGIEIVEPPCDQFVGVCLVTDIPNHAVMIEVEGLVQSECELYNTQAWTEVSTTGRHNLQMPLTDLPCHILELSRAESVQFIRMLEISEMHALPVPMPSIYGNQP
jgi:hypothetical protein